MLLKELNVLLAEDQEDEVALFELAIAKSLLPTHTLRVVQDGSQAIAYLRGDGDYADREKNPFPNILLLDIKMPKSNGFDVLRWLDAHEDCCVIPTIIFTSSDQPDDIKSAFKMGANAYFCKPVAFNELRELMSLIFHYWTRSHVPCPPPQGKCQ